MVVGIMFVLVNIYEIYDRTFAGWDWGVVLLKYTIQGNKYTIMKRSTQRSIFIQIMLFSMNGIYTLFKDRKQELMIFATGQIYRETGTAQEVETDVGLKWRVKWGQRGTGASGLLVLVCWIAGQDIASIVFGALVLIFFVRCITKTYRL